MYQSSNPPWRRINHFHNDFERLFDGLGLARNASPAARPWQPRVDIREEATRYVIELDVPGVSSEAIDIATENGVLTIQGERRRTASADGEQQTRHSVSERPCGAFRRSFTLPEQADVSAIRASMDAGVLQVVIPKRPEQQPRRIEIA